MADARPLDLATGRFQALRLNAGAPRGLVLVLHGFPDHPPTFAPLAERIAQAGYDVVVPWLRGYAPSTTSGPFSLEQLTADALALVDALADGRPVHLVGHDWGALVTYATLAAAPARFRAAVTLAVPHPHAFTHALGRGENLLRSSYMLLFQLRIADRLTRARDFALVDLLWRRWSPGFTLPAPARAALHDCLRASWPAPLEYYRALARPLPDAIARVRNLGRIHTPVLQVHGEDDGCIGPTVGDDQARWFDGPFERRVVAGAGHFLHAEEPVTVADAALAWLAAYQQ